MYRIQIVLIILIIAFSSSCETKTEQKEEGLTLKGNLVEPRYNEKGYIYLEETVANGYKKVDSTQLKDGKDFSFKVKITEPGFYRLDVLHEQYVDLVLNKENITLTIDLKNFEKPYTASGSKEMQYYEVVKRTFNEFKQEQERFVQNYEQTIDTNQHAKIIAEYTAYQKQSVATLKGIIDTIAPSIVALYAANALEIESDLDYLVQLATRFNKDLPNSTYTKKFSEYVDVYKKTAIGQPAPEIALPNPLGQVISLSSLKGKVVLIDFWASWCLPCRQENPNVVKIYQKYKDKGFEILSVSLDDDKKAWEFAIIQDKLTWQHVSDLKKWESIAAKTYNIKAIPATLLIDKTGKIIAKNLRGEALEEKINEAI